MWLIEREGLEFGLLWLEMGHIGLTATSSVSLDHHELHPAWYIDSVRAYRLTPVE